MSYGTQSFSATVVLTFCREYDTGGDTPDSDVVFLDAAEVIAGGLPYGLEDRLVLEVDVLREALT